MIYEKEHAIIKHIVIGREENIDGNIKVNFVKLVPVDLRHGTCDPYLCMSQALPDVNIGDIVDINIATGQYRKILYGDCKPAIIIGSDVIVADGHAMYAQKQVIFFNKEFGQHTIILNHKDKFFYTKRGDEVLVRKNGDKKYEIATNITVDKMRSDFLIKQK